LRCLVIMRRSGCGEHSCAVTQWHERIRECRHVGSYFSVRRMPIGECLSPMRAFRQQQWVKPSAKYLIVNGGKGSALAG
jgi:hypothetical protein